MTKPGTCHTSRLPLILKKSCYHPRLTSQITDVFFFKMERFFTLQVETGDPQYPTAAHVVQFYFFVNLTTPSMNLHNFNLSNIFRSFHLQSINQSRTFQVRDPHLRIVIPGAANFWRTFANCRVQSSHPFPCWISGTGPTQGIRDITIRVDDNEAILAFTASPKTFTDPVCSFWSSRPLHFHLNSFLEDQVVLPFRSSLSIQGLWCHPGFSSFHNICPAYHCRA